VFEGSRAFLEEDEPFRERALSTLRPLRPSVLSTSAKRKRPTAYGLGSTSRAFSKRLTFLENRSRREKDADKLK
jgi:hypothetical protein